MAEKLDKLFIKEQASEEPKALPAGPFAGGNPIPEPEEGTTEGFGVVVGKPPDSEGEGAGANNESGTTVGGAISSTLITEADSHNTGARLERSVLRENKVANYQNEILTLILFEDTDAALSEDHGFISTIQQLAETAKQPMILTSNSNNPVVPKSLDRLELNFAVPSLKELFGLVRVNDSLITVKETFAKPSCISSFGAKANLLWKWTEALSGWLPPSTEIPSSTWMEALLASIHLDGEVDGPCLHPLGWRYLDEGK
ncbi:unnamed protein product [Fraxinus pennsylvanica]|uniref:Uncharacterized protein n=1 Tax=Fraxinus pennsylvanica TaxID=56036 RepID=A0AAD2A348_9LAMI|nr:unnamed protein product [Fraxinus pennsylvanica]